VFRARLAAEGGGVAATCRETGWRMGRDNLQPPVGDEDRRAKGGGGGNAQSRDALAFLDRTCHRPPDCLDTTQQRALAVGLLGNAIDSGEVRSSVGQRFGVRQRGGRQTRQAAKQFDLGG
jgi:hypothetical protein